jgi:transcriptional regulator with XRE-family HTH domain
MEHFYVGKGITYYREQKGLNVSQLAEKVGMAQGTISNYENGHRKVSDDALEKIAVALDVSIRAIVERAEYEHRKVVSREDADKSYLRKLRRKDALRTYHDAVIELSDDLLLSIKTRLHDLNSEEGSARVGFNRERLPSGVEAIFEKVFREFLREHSDEITHRLYEELEFAQMGIDDIIRELNNYKRR